MQDINKLCLGCMKEKTVEGICTCCGFDLKKYMPPIYHLKPQTILYGKYLVGKAIGEGGFGITYIGWDLNLNLPIAIKEYFPSGFAIRDSNNSDHVTAFTGKKEEFYKQGKQKFVQEAQAIARFYEQDEIVLVRDYFLENGTAYIVMEYIAGKTFMKILGEYEKRGDRLSTEQVFDMMKPLIQSLEIVHKEGIIHRDISPDNIMIAENGKVKLIDFGAARGFTDGDKTFSVMLKAGYAPEEQYRTNGKQGPWTDIYALCATIYRALTGKKPPNSIDRLRQDDIELPSKLGVSIDTNLENALMKGLAVKAEDRWKNMGELYHAFYDKAGYGFQQMPQGIRRDKKDVDITRLSTQSIPIPSNTGRNFAENTSKYNVENNLENLKLSGISVISKNKNLVAVIIVLALVISLVLICGVTMSMLKRTENAKEEVTTSALQKAQGSEEASPESSDKVQLSAEEQEKEEDPVSTQKIIAIDPGHQGWYVDMSAQEPAAPGSSETKAKGTSGTSGTFSDLPEYQLNLDVSLKLRDELLKRGYQVIMTREDNDTAISNSERAQLAAECGADIFIRIHADGEDDGSSASGGRTIISTENNPYVGELYEDSKALAECILDSYCKATGFKKLSIIETDSMSGINWSQVPVVFLEMGYMSNKHDDLYMADEDNQFIMAEGIANGIDKYFEY